MDQSYLELETKLAEALEQKTATAEVLRVISSSPGNLKPVFETILANATRLCHAKFGTLYLHEKDGFRAVAMHNAPPAFAEARSPPILQAVLTIAKPGTCPACAGFFFSYPRSGEDSDSESF